MDLRGVDLNLLVVFAALAEQRSVTRAAESLGASQPATSAALARLRLLLADPLFVKAGSEMRPTPRAAQMVAPVRRVLDTVKEEILQARAFDPAATERVVTVLTPDIGEVNFLPRLLAHLAASAPGVNVRALSMPPRAAAGALESGLADLAVGYFPDLHRAGFFQQRLFGNAHVCIVRRDHPTIGETLTLRQFLAAHHAVVRPEGREHVFEQFLQGKGLQRRVRLEVSHFMSLLPIISGSDLLATVPHDMAEVCVRHGGVRMLPTPMKSPVIDVHQFWHRRLHKDVAHGWLRGVVNELFSAQAAEQPDRRQTR
jgi:DNA-binding transcriptional LysR family regulator